MRLPLRQGLRIVIVIAAMLACLAVVWRGIDYYNDLQVARQLESFGVKVSWKHLHVSYVEICHLRSGKELANICTHLDRLSRLDTIDINYGSLSDEDLRYLSNLTTVRWLSIFDLHIDGSGLKHLNRMHGLKRLTLSKTDVNDGTVGNVNLFKGLNRLDIEDSRVTAEGIAKLKGLTHLSTLVLSESDIDDRAAPILARMKTLRDLRLDDTKITDAAVEYLAQLKGLRYLWIKDTRITPNGLRILMKKLPDTGIFASQETMYEAMQTGQGIEKGGSKKVSDGKSGTDR